VKEWGEKVIGSVEHVEELEPSITQKRGGQSPKEITAADRSRQKQQLLGKKIGRGG